MIETLLSAPVEDFPIAHDRSSGGGDEYGEIDVIADRGVSPAHGNGIRGANRRNGNRHRTLDCYSTKSTPRQRGGARETGPLGVVTGGHEIPRGSRWGSAGRTREY